MLNFRTLESVLIHIQRWNIFTLHVYILKNIDINFKGSVKRKIFSSYLGKLPDTGNDATGRVSFARAINFYVSNFFPLPDERRETTSGRITRFPEFYVRSSNIAPFLTRKTIFETLNEYIFHVPHIHHSIKIKNLSHIFIKKTRCTEILSSFDDSEKSKLNLR